MKLSSKSLNEITGGVSITATLFSSVSSLMNNIFQIGQVVGTTARRVYTNSVCSI